MVPYGNSSIILELRQVDRTHFIGDFTHKLSIVAIGGWSGVVTGCTVF